MPGIYGSRGDADPSRLEETVCAGSRHASVTVSDDPVLGMVHHGRTDPGGWQLIEGSGVVGVVYGCVTNHDLHPATVRDLIRRPLDGLPHLDGPFALAGYDRDRDELLLATDKLGTRSLYYTPTRPVTFGSELSTPIAQRRSAHLDAASVGDMLLMSKVWGEKTLVEEVKRLRPGSFLKLGDDGVNQQRYWTFAFGEASPEGYADALADRYRDALDDVLRTVGAPPRVWLSGGLDSRILAGAMRSVGRDFHAVTYRRPTEHSRDPLWDDVTVARKVVERLGGEHDVVTHDPSTLADRLDTFVRLTDGHVAWPSLSNLGSVFDLDLHGSEVMLEGPVPLLTGEKVEYPCLQAERPAEETLVELHAYREPEVAASFLAADRNPVDTFRREVQEAGYSRPDRQVLAVTNDNYYSAGHFVANKIARARVGTRETLVDAELLQLLARMPPDMRRRRLPFSSVPHVPSRLKLHLAREFGRGVRTIPYSMTKLPPILPYHLHGLAFPVVCALRRVTSDRSLSEWVRSHPALRDKIGSLVEDAGRNPIFDKRRVEEVWQAHLAGEADRLGLIGAITTVERFRQQYLESRTGVEQVARLGA